MNTGRRRFFYTLYDMGRVVVFKAAVGNAPDSAIKSINPGSSRTAVVTAAPQIKFIPASSRSNFRV
jgi:hypothetical protein